MLVTIEELSPVQREMSVTVEQTELKPYFEQAYRAQQKKVNLRGFRPGKAPLEVVKQMYGREVEHTALERVADRAFKHEVTERQLPVIGTPELVDMAYQPNQPFSFKVRFEVPPTVELGSSMEDLTAERLVLTVTDESVEEALTSLRRNTATMSATDEAAAEHDVVTADFVRLDGEDQPKADATYPDQKVQLDAPNVNPLLKQELIGARPGDTRRIDLTFTRSDGTEVLDDAGGRDVFQVTVKSVERPELPEADDAFAQTVSGGRIETIEALREDIRRQLSSQFAARAEEMVNDRLASQLVERIAFPVPTAFVNGMLDSFLADVKRQQQGNELPADFDQAAFREVNRELASNRAKWMLIRDRIVETEGLTVSPEQFDEAVEAQIGTTGLDPNRVRAFFQNPKNRGPIEEQVLNRQVFDLLKSRATITERDAAEAEQAAQAEQAALAAAQPEAAAETPPTEA